MSDQNKASSSGQQRENRKTSRVRLDSPLRVVLSSIGAGVRYEMVTADVSINGFFLDFEKPGRFPFTPASIMEVWMELKPGNMIFFNGKMARVVKGQGTEQNPGQDSGPGIAIKIIQIDRENEAALRDFIISKHQELQEKTQNVA